MAVCTNTFPAEDLGLVSAAKLPIHVYQIVTEVLGFPYTCN